MFVLDTLSIQARLPTLFKKRPRATLVERHMYAKPIDHSSRMTQTMLRNRLGHLAQRHRRIRSMRMLLHTPLLRIRLPRAQRTHTLDPLHRMPIIPLLYRKAWRRRARHVDLLDVGGVFRAGQREVEVLEGAAAWAPCGN
jgi:hypothetical protein